MVRVHKRATLKQADIRDVEFQMPGKLDEIRHWYRVYKVAEGKKENTFAFNGECLDKVLDLQQGKEVLTGLCRRAQWTFSVTLTLHGSSTVSCDQRRFPGYLDSNKAACGVIEKSKG